MTCFFPMARRKRASQPLVVEECWPTKKARVNGCRKKRSVPAETEPDRVEVQTEENPAAHKFQTEETAVEVETEKIESPVKKTKMISELVCVVEQKTRSGKAKKGTRRGRKNK